MTLAPIETRERDRSLDELEALWRAPAAEPRRRHFELPRVSGIALALGWAVFMVAAMAASAAANPQANDPAWAEAVAVAFTLLLPATALVGVVVPTLGFGLAVGAGGLGMALAVACRATGHHLGAWWLVELGVTTALTTLAVTGLAQRLRR